MKMVYVLSLTTDNTLRVLQRIATIFTRKRLNIEQMSACDLGQGKVTHISVTVCSTDHDIHDLINKLNKIVELHEVKIICAAPSTK